MKIIDIESQDGLRHITFWILITAYALSSLLMLNSLNVIDGLSGYIWGSWVAYLLDAIKVGVFVATLMALILKKECRNWHFVFIFTLTLLMLSVTETVAHT